MIGSLFLAILFWVVYFFVIFFVCHWLYQRLIGPEPKPEAPSVMLQGKPVKAKEIWELRAKRLRQVLIILAAALMLLPLFLPFVLLLF